MEKEIPTTLPVTFTEGLVLALTAITILPHDPTLMILAAPAGVALWAARRSETVRGWATQQLAIYEPLDFPGNTLIVAGLNKLPVPSVHIPKLLTSDTTAQKITNIPVAASTKKKIVDALPPSFFSAFGEDDPRKSQIETSVPSEPVIIDVTPTNKRDAEAVSQAKVAKTTEEDTLWLAQNTELPAVKKPRQRALLTIREVCRLLNDEVDDRPHVIVFGNSGAGKTVLVQLLIGTRPGKVVILDPKRPKGWEGIKWGGLPYVSRDKETSSYQPLVNALAAVVHEMNERYRIQDEVTAPFTMLTVVLDEAKNAVEESPELAELYRKIVSIGREVNIRLVLLSTTDRARKLGFDGEADSMDSFAHIRLGVFATKVLDTETLAEQGDKRYLWAALLLEEWKAFDNKKTYEYVEKLTLGKTKVWEGVTCNCQLEKQHTTNADDHFLEQLLLQNSESVKSFSTEVLPGSTSKNIGKYTSREAEVLPREKYFHPTSQAVEVLPHTDTNTHTIPQNQVFRMAAKCWREASDVEQTLAKNTLHSKVRGMTSRQAIIHHFGVTGGRKYRRAVELCEALEVLRTETIAHLKREKQQGE